MTAKRDARMVAAMLEEMRLKASSMRNNELSREEVRWRWSSGSWAGLENVMDQEVRGGGEGSGSCEHASQTALGVWGRRTRRANLRRSISADTLAGSALNSSISVGECRGCWNSSRLSGRRSEVGGVDSPTAKAGSITGCLSRSLCSAAVCDSTTINAETANETKSTMNSEFDAKEGTEREFPSGHVITGCLEGDVWRGPGVKRSHSVTERLHHASIRATSLRSDLLALLVQAEIEDQGLQEAARKVVAAKRFGDGELEAEGERELLLGRERREAVLSKAEAMTTHSRTRPPAGDAPVPTATLTLSDLHVTVSTENSSVLGGSRPQYCVRDPFLCLVRDTVGGSVVATEVEQLTGGPGSGSGELVFHSTMRWAEQSADFRLHVELYHLPAPPVCGTLDHSTAQRKGIPSLLSRALLSSPIKSWRRRSTKHRRKGPSQGRTAGSERQDVGSSRFNLVGHVEVNVDGGEGHQVACLGPRFQIEFDVSFEPEWEEDCTLGGFLTVQSGRGWEVLWCLLCGPFLYFWCYPEEVEQSKIPSHHIDLRHCKELALSASKEVCVRKNAILLRLSEGVALLVANSKAEQGRWIAALNKVINTALTWKQA